MAALNSDSWNRDKNERLAEKKKKNNAGNSIGDENKMKKVAKPLVHKCRNKEAGFENNTYFYFFMLCW